MYNTCKYTANYSHSNHNFVIQNLINNGTPVDKDVFSTCCVLKNILQRGKPSLMSTFLQDKVGAIHKSEGFENAQALINKDVLAWRTTIKGSDKNCNNPAQDFYYNIIPKYFGDYKFIQNLILPEVLINTITQEYNEEFIHQQVDFYLSQAFLVIEIDGYQHETGSQSELDKKRDEYLKTKGYKVFRFTTEELDLKNNSFNEKIKQIITYLDKINKRQLELKQNDPSLMALSDYNASYLKGIDNDNVYCKATAIIRFQILILELLCNGKLSFDRNWNFEILYQDICNDFVQLAIDDLINWFSLLFSIRKIPFDFSVNHKVTITRIYDVHDFSNNRNAIMIDYSLLKRYTDENERFRNIIFVRNDYFDKYILVERKNKPLEDIDYFTISTADIIKYDLSITSKEDYNALLQLAWDIFLQSKSALKRESFSFREGQFEVIANILNRNDTIGLLPTGSGKSICYQLACILQPAINFVVCPIISLMIDQVENLNSAYIYHIAAISGNLDASEKSRIQYNFSRGKYFFIFISPERLQTASFRHYLSNLNEKYSMAHIVIDEAHCLSEWGHDFRISYLNLVDTVKSICNNYKFIALTATASEKVLEDLKLELEIYNDSDVKRPMVYSRDELEFSVTEDIGDKYSSLLELFDNINSNPFYSSSNNAGLVFVPYAGGRSGTNVISSKLHRDLNKPVGCYNGKLSDSDKKAAQCDFKNNTTNLLVATKAFGMGIDKGNIAYTIHHGIPSSMESLYQEAGRAGREKELFKSNKALCKVLLTKENMDEKQENILWSKESTYEEKCEVYKELTGDLKTQLYFFVAGNESIEDGCSKIRELYNKIIELVDSNSTELKYRLSRNDTEKYLYKLKVLGIIYDWTIDFKTGIFTLAINKQNINNSVAIKSILTKYINKYDKEFSFEKIISDSAYSKYKRIFKKQNTDFDKYVEFLLQWNFDTFVYSRLQSLKNLYENCVKYADCSESNNKAFKNSIENYFKATGKVQILKTIANQPLNYKNWFDVFYVFNEDMSTKTDEIISNRDAQSLMENLSRLLESYMQNTGLDFVSGLTRLFLDDYDNADGRIRFESALKKIKKMDKNEQEDIMFNLFAITKTLPMKNKNELSESLINSYSKDKDFLFKVYDNLEDDKSLLLVSENFLKRVKNVKDILEVK